MKEPSTSPTDPVPRAVSVVAVMQHGTLYHRVPRYWVLGIAPPGVAAREAGPGTLDFLFHPILSWLEAQHLTNESDPLGS